MANDDFDFDFGFTAVDETELKSGEIEAQEKLQEKLEGLRKMIMPLLNNLKQNPDKDVIKWNGKERAKKIDEFIKKMDNYIKS